MPCRPPQSDAVHARDFRLDPYRERAAILASGTGREATLFIRVEAWWTSTGGHLWWRRWSDPYEVPHGYLLFRDGEFDDWVVDRQELEKDLADWSQSRFRYVGEHLVVEWLDAAASQHVRDHVFGLDPL